MSRRTAVPLSFEGEELESVLVGRRDRQPRPMVMLFPTVMGVSDFELDFGRQLVELGYDCPDARAVGRMVQGGNSDAAAVHLVRAGVPTGIVNLARRYSHSPVEVLDIHDAVGALDLIEAFAREFSAETDLSFFAADTMTPA